MAMNAPAQLPDLAACSARIGADPLLVQAAGGNTSIKDGDVMWIKASGLLLADALARDVFVPVDWRRMRHALSSDVARADKPADFTVGEQQLRPSIETSLHAAFEQKVVIHVHCVNTIAQAVLEDAQSRFATRLAGFNWAFQAYAKPGATLAAGVREKLTPDTDVVVLGNHGLFVAAETVEDAETLLERVVEAVRVSVARGSGPDISAIDGLAIDGYEPFPADHPLHVAACDDRMFDIATGGSLYPDHVIFLGVGAAGSVDLAGIADVVADAPPLFLVRGVGAMARCDLSVPARAMARCLGDVVARVPGDGVPHYLTLAENAELLDWDAEKYRQKLNAG
jgi:rhamnose utilization protein RhaD (predicted bifunctional aldolase and dehydrogenase)